MINPRRKIHLYGAFGVTQCNRIVRQGDLTLLDTREAFAQEIPRLCKVCLQKVGKEV